ncbi:hypothetical protein MMC06_005596 [Schaereria dolodes]|nr:hypothetical protein [Schaereria dolodes]
MPRKKWIDKSASTTFALVHRPQNDPKIHDVSSSSMVFQELPPPQAHKIKNRSDLESELFASSEDGRETGRVRDNEGEAAEHGIYYDDTEYDYMQHMRDLNGGDGNVESYFLDAPVSQKDAKGKRRIKLEDALRNTSLEDTISESGVKETGEKAEQLLDDDILPSKALKKTTYQDQQDIPDTLAGFQPDLDPRLREVLEALDDEAYVDEEEDLFGEIAQDKQEISLAEFEELGFVEDEDRGNDQGWESDDTAKPSREYQDTSLPSVPNATKAKLVEDLDHGNGDWMEEFSKFKKTQNAMRKARPQASSAELQSSIMTGTSMTGGRRKKRKGAMTSSTGYSMTSSSLLRTEGHTLLDARFDKIEEEYAEDNMEADIDDDDGTTSVFSGTVSVSSSQVPALTTREDFDNIMDEFLEGYSMSGKKRIKKGGYQSGIEQLDEIRRELGRPKLGVQRAH